MAKLSEEAKKAIGELSPSVVATANKDGKPNVSLKGSFRVLDDEHILFADIASPRTTANLRENPQLSAIVFDAANRKGCRVWGKAVEILDNGNLFDTISAEYSAKGMKVKHVVKVKVDEAITF
ncbi:MAG TPA: pyridoxamine 5'-phosphate oxidase family protein [Dehalococcoidia bacterium]|nr:pyridoxamine 5'-phosphate oxidase family protein [Dehalococcoidia bacterium]